MITAASLICACTLLQSMRLAASLTVQDYFGQYYFGGDTQSGSILVTAAGKTKSGAKYNAPYSDLKDFPHVVKQEDLDNALWVWLPGSNAYNGEGWYHHDTIYKVRIEKDKLTGYTGDMQREANGRPRPNSNQGKARLQITLQDGNALTMHLGGGFGQENWVHYLSSSVV